MTDWVAITLTVLFGGFAIGQFLVGRHQRDDARNWRTQDEARRAAEAEAAREAAGRRATGVRYLKSLNDALTELDALNDIACKVITSDELLTGPRMAELGVPDLLDRLGNIGARLPAEIKRFVEDCDDGGNGVHFWGHRFFEASLDPAQASPTTAGYEAVHLYKVAIELDKAIDVAREAIRDMLPS